MGIRTYAHFAGWSPDAAAAAFIEERTGPEGGGSLALLVAADGAVRRFLFSSTFSPGNGSKPQTVSAAACRRAAENASAALTTLGFTSVRVNAAGCDARERSGIVVPREAVEPHVWSLATQPFFALRDGRLAHDRGVVYAELDGFKVVALHAGNEVLQVYRADADRALVIEPDADTQQLPVIVRRARTLTVQALTAQ